MGSIAEAPPRGGEIIYEVIRIRTWFSARYATYAKGVSNLFFLDRLKEAEQEKYYRLMEANMREIMRFLDSVDGVLNAFGHHHIAYGKWVDDDLYPALFNRLELVAQHSIWGTLDLHDKVCLVAQVIFETIFWCAALRAAAWKGNTECRETPFVFIDRSDRRHIIDLTRIPSVRRYGPKPDIEAGA